VTIQVVAIDPTPAPRQSRRDRWRPSPSVARYRAYRDEIALTIRELPADFFHVVFLLPMPRSWSDRKKSELAGWPHTGTPDKDNLEKGLIDAVYRNRDDSHVWNTASTKLWAYQGAIVISDDFLPIFELPVDLAELVRGSWAVYDRTPVV
jgi:Holliday junction resolvase RusA-like endonuclease